MTFRTPASRDKLAASFESFLKLRFPPAPEHEALADVHADLAEYDGYIAGLVARAIEAAPLPHPLAPAADLRKRIDEAVLLDVAARPDAERLIRYLDALESLAAQARETAGEPEP